MSETLKKIEEYRRQLLLDLYSQCTESQQVKFKMMHKSIDDIPDDKIEIAILQCEKALQKNSVPIDKPIQLKEINLEILRKTCQDYIDFIYSNEYHEDNDYTHYIYEAAMQSIFGENVFDIINKRIREHEQKRC